MGSTPDVFDWASVVLSNNYMKTIPHENRNDLLHSMLEPYEITIIADRDKIILDGPWGNILKSKVKLSEYFLETNSQPQTIECIMESSTLANDVHEEILTGDAFEITNEETLAETLSVYETAMLLKHHSCVDLQSNEHGSLKTKYITSTPEGSVPVVSEKLVKDNPNPPGRERLPKKVRGLKAPIYRGKYPDPTDKQCENTTSSLCDGEKELYITIALSSNTDDFQNAIKRLGRPATLNLDEITGEILHSNASFKSLALEESTSNDVSKENQKEVVAVNERVNKKNTSRNKTPKDERGYRITRKDRVVGGTSRESPNTNVGNKVKEQVLGTFKFSCDKCSLKTNQRNYYRKHMKLHEKNHELLSCTRCDYKTVGRTSLGRHKKQHTPLKLSCELCNYRTNEEKRLENHQMKKHTDKERIYECTHCDYSTAVWYQIKRHVQEHVLSEEAVFRCQECPYTSLFKRQISRHIKTVHLNVRPFLCDTCGRRFKRRDNLKAHSYLHGPIEQKFPCPVCARVYVTPAYLASHMISHSKERPFLCEVCGASFKMLGTQRKHMAIVHRNPGRFSCDGCGRKFNRKFTLIRHMKTHRMCGSSVKDGSQTQNRPILPISLLGGDQIALITTTGGQADLGSSFQGETTMLLQPDSARVMFESQTMTVMEGQLDAATMTILTEVDEVYDAASQGETATALLYLTNN